MSLRDTSTSKSTVAALIVQGSVLIIGSSIEFALAGCCSSTDYRVGVSCNWYSEQYCDRNHYTIKAT